MAYLNILFAPATEAIRREVVAELEIPQALAELYKDLNGFHLLQTISVYGLLPSSGYLLNRQDSYQRLPFNLRDQNREAGTSHTSHLTFDSYDYDGSGLFIHRRSGEITCFAGVQRSDVRMRWPSLDEWLDSELERLSPFVRFEGQHPRPLRKCDCQGDPGDLEPTRAHERPREPTRSPRGTGTLTVDGISAKSTKVLYFSGLRSDQDRKSSIPGAAAPISPLKSMVRAGQD